jgi:hypothetical protein
MAGLPGGPVHAAGSGRFTNYRSKSRFANPPDSDDARRQSDAHRIWTAY